MKILQLCNKPPVPSIDGGCIAMNNVTQGLLQNGCQLKLLTVSTDKHPFNQEFLSQDYIKNTGIESVYIDSRLNIVDAFSNLVTSDSYNVSRFFSPDFDRLLVQTLKDEEFDIVHMESLFMTPYIDTIKRLSKAKIVLRSHNLEHIIWERLAVNTRNKVKKVYTKYLAKKLKNYEMRVLGSIDALVTITKGDSERYKKINAREVPVITVPFGINLADYKVFSGNQHQLFHIGAMNWTPNIEGVSWFIEDVLPLIRKQFQDMELHLAGREMPEWLFDKKQEGVVAYGEVESACDFMKPFTLMLVPLLSAGGMRVKIIEGMAMGKCVITTSIGAEGIDYTNGENIIIADSPKDFLNEIKRLLNNPEKIMEVGMNARKLVEEKYDNQKIIKKLVDFYKSL